MLECGGEERLAGQEQYDEFRRGAGSELFPVRLACECVDVATQVRGVRAEETRAFPSVCRSAGVEICAKWRLCIDDHGAIAGKPNDEVGPEAPDFAVVGLCRQRHLWLEIA